MHSSDKLDALVNEVMSRLGGHDKENCNNKGSKTCNTGNAACTANPCNVAFTPAKALVIAALIGGVLEVDSVLMDRNQGVEIVLVGSLKQKTQLEKILDQVGTMPFDSVMRTMLERFT